MSDETVKNNETTVKIDQTSNVKDKNSMLNSFKQEFSTSVISIYVNSLKRDVNFREVTVKEQKSLSKTMIQNQNRKDIIYNNQCALINNLCLEEGFDIYKLTEFDRIKILMEIYSSNYIQNDLTFKCPECGAENSYKLDFDSVVKKLNKFTLEDQTYSMEDKIRIYNFTLNYPTVYNVSEFYKDYLKQYKNATQKEIEMLDNMGNIEYINLFVNKIETINKQSNNKQSIDLTLLSLDEIESLFSIFPQNILFDEKNGVLQHITTKFIEKINGAFQYQTCAQCGHKTQEGMGSLTDFF